MATTSHFLKSRDAACHSPSSATSHKALIGVMGVTGSGKSSLITDVVGCDNIVGHHLESETAKVTPYEVVIGSTSLVLVDTPGFDDSTLSDFEILHIISDWLDETLEEGRRLNGLIYLHPIHQTRMAGSAVRALRLFQRICGEESYQNVILATTFWNKIEHCKHEGVEREGRIMAGEGFWKTMKDAGAQTVRLSRNYRDIIPNLLDIASRPKVTLAIQDQLSNGVPLEQTTAGLLVKDESNALEQQYEADISSLRDGVARRLDEYEAQNSRVRAARQRELAEEMREHSSSIRITAEQMQHQLRQLELEYQKKQAMLAEMLRKDEEYARQIQQEQEAAQRKQRREEGERESKLHYRWSLMQRDKVQRQLEELAAARSAGNCNVSMPGVSLDGSITRSGLSSWCDFCLKAFGIGERIRCPTCAAETGESTPIEICSECYRDGRRCFNWSHTMISTSPYPDDYEPEGGICNRLLSTNDLTCDVEACHKKIEGAYFHCCKCNDDNLDICIDCVTQGYYCSEMHDLTLGVEHMRVHGITDE